MESKQYPLITIVTVSFNAVNSIEETIKSVINQTYANIEYIVIDGGSKDGTIDVIKKYRGKKQAVRLQYTNEQLEKYNNIDYSTAFIYHSGVDKNELLTVEEMAKSAGFRQVITAFTGCMISLHSARGALGLHFIAD